jgi:hypothetical protein
LSADAERKGFIKLSEGVAEWLAANVKPLRIIEVNGTAAAAGVGDILVDLRVTK